MSDFSMFIIYLPAHIFATYKSFMQYSLESFFDKIEYQISKILLLGTENPLILYYRGFSFPSCWKSFKILKDGFMFACTNAGYVYQFKWLEFISTVSVHAQDRARNVGLDRKSFGLFSGMGGGDLKISF